MSVSLSQSVGRSGVAYSGDVADIPNAGDQSLSHPVLRELLSPEQQALSLPQQDASRPMVAPLTRHLGPQLTVANPVWIGDPVPRLRGLQKLLIEHSLATPESDRPEFMAAISVVERAVQLRLRLQQMHMNELEPDSNPEDSKPEKGTRS
ncbi:MAG TPA: hypothetical protein VJ654_03335 [Noviherbaspirillum sp.]|nr:hypothetical protein [Noviherbaspirillum sp.]